MEEVKFIKLEAKLMKKRALISVFYKDGVLEFAKFLEKRGVEILSTGGTYKHLKHYIH